MKRTLLIILACFIAIPFLLIAEYLSYSYSVDAYARHILKKAAPDAVKILRNAQIYILRGNKVYTLQGQEVK